MAYQNFYGGGYYPQYNGGAMPDMLNQYKGQYQQPMMQMPVQPPQMSITNDVLWVLNENEATSYPVAPNNNVVLWDKNKPTIYVKSVNAQGVPSMRVLDFTERNTDAQSMQSNAPKTHKCDCEGKFATKEQINDLKGKIIDLEARLNDIDVSVTEKPKSTAKKAKESED